MQPPSNIIDIYKSQGWNDEASIRADIAAGGWKTKVPQTSSSASATDPIELARKYQQFQIEANQPAIQQLQSSIPGVQQKFAAERQSLEAEKNPLEQRYQTLLADVTKQTSIATSREAGRRGVSTESGMYDEWLAERIEPKTQELGLARESDLRNITNLISQLTSGETEATNSIQSQIAQLLAGNASSSISSAQNWQQILEQARQFDVGAELQKQEANRTSLADQYATIGEGSTLYNLLTGQTYTAPKTYASSAGGGGGWE